MALLNTYIDAGNVDAIVTVLDDAQKSTHFLAEHGIEYKKYMDITFAQKTRHSFSPANVMRCLKTKDRLLAVLEHCARHGGTNPSVDYETAISLARVFVEMFPGDDAVFKFSAPVTSAAMYARWNAETRARMSKLRVTCDA